MHILYVLRHDPWGVGGGCSACRGYLEALGAVFAGSEMDVCICEEYVAGRNMGDFPFATFVPVKPRSLVDKLLTPVTRIMHRHQSTVKRLLSERKYAYCIFDDNCIAGSLVDLCIRNDVRTIVINHNCECEYYRDNTSGARRRMLLPVVRHNEDTSYRRCDVNIFLTDEDMATFKRLYGDSQTRQIVGGCFVHKGTEAAPVSPEPLNGDTPTVVISGTIGNIQNIDGINYFLESLYKHLPTGSRVVIAGKNAPANLASRLSSYGNITLIDSPKNILEIVSRGDIFLCPTRLGGGMKLRVMDGLRCGLPVIAHEVSARGYSEFVRHGYLKAFSSAETFAPVLADTLAAIHQGTLRRSDIATAAQRSFGFDSAVNRLRDCLLPQ